MTVTVDYAAYGQPSLEAAQSFATCAGPVHEVECVAENSLLKLVQTYAHAH